MPRIKTSITPPEDLRYMDRADSNRSAYLARLEKAQREARDAEIINANASRLNREARGVLEYQGLPADPAAFDAEPRA